MHILSTPIEYLKGVGPAKAELLKKEVSIFTYGDLLQYYPFRYIDKSKVFNISDISDDMPYIQLKGKIIQFEEIGQKRFKRLVAKFKDETGLIDLVWFKGVRWIKSYLKLNQDYLIFGKPTFLKENLILHILKLNFMKIILNEIPCREYIIQLIN